MDDTRAVVKNFILAKLVQGSGHTTLADDMELKESRILDSLATVELAMFLEDRFRIEINASDLDSSNRVSIDSIARLVEAKIADR